VSTAAATLRSGRDRYGQRSHREKLQRNPSVSPRPGPQDRNENNGLGQHVPARLFQRRLRSWWFFRGRSRLASAARTIGRREGLPELRDGGCPGAEYRELAPQEGMLDEVQLMATAALPGGTYSS